MQCVTLILFPGCSSGRILDNTSANFRDRLRFSKVLGLWISCRSGKYCRGRYRSSPNGCCEFVSPTGGQGYRRYLAVRFFRGVIYRVSHVTPSLSAWYVLLCFIAFHVRRNGCCYLWSRWGIVFSRGLAGCCSRIFSLSAFRFGGLGSWGGRFFCFGLLFFCSAFYLFFVAFLAIFHSRFEVHSFFVHVFRGGVIFVSMRLCSSGGGS